MERKRLVNRVLIVLLDAMITGFSVLMPHTIYAQRIVPADLDNEIADAPASALALPGWQQVNSNGFGDPGAGEVSAVEVFNGYLYAGTHNPLDPGVILDGARIFRSLNGTTWSPVTQPGFGNSHDIAPPAILDFAPFNGKLYAGTGRGNASQLWRTANGTIWAPMDVTGFSDPENVAVTALAEYDGKFYAGVTNNVTGAQIWSSFTGDNNSWTQVAPDEPGTSAASVTGLAEFDGALYAAIESEVPAQIWRSYGAAWTTVISDGFGSELTTLTGGMAVFGSYLYAGAGNTDTGAQLWRTNDGDTWEPAISPGFGDPNNLEVEMVFVFQNQLYAGVKNTSTGMEIWRSANGTTWERANQDGFGDSKNSTSNMSNAAAEFLDHLYVGTSNVADGGELWRIQNPYGVNLSPDASLPGPAGGQVVYMLTITNTGYMTDSFDLTATGQTWTTTLGASTVNLAPSATAVFTVAVAIPPGAADQETDTVTITATSQGDSRKADSAVLTSTSIAVPVYGVKLSPDASLSGPPSGQLVYTLIVTNTGNVVDTFDLLNTGSSWATALSTQAVTLAPSASTVFSVTVTVPPGAADQETDAVTITATSQGDSNKTDVVVLTSTSVSAHVCGVKLSPDDSLSGPSGGQVVYTLTITNTGDMTDSFDLAAAGNSWETAPSSQVVTLAPSASTAFTVAVTIPPGAADQETDAVTITATSQGDSSKADSAVLTSISIAVPVYGVKLSPDASLSGPAGGQVVYELTITNTGNVVDTFDLLSAGNSWTTTLSSQLVTMAASSSRAVTVTVSIPPTAAALESEQVSVQATSRHDTSKNDTVTLTTVSTGQPAELVLPAVLVNTSQ